jgi:hypothetical protein
LNEIIPEIEYRGEEAINLQDRVAKPPRCPGFGGELAKHHADTRVELFSDSGNIEWRAGNCSQVNMEK